MTKNVVTRYKLLLQGIKLFLHRLKQTKGEREFCSCYPRGILWYVHAQTVDKSVEGKNILSSPRRDIALATMLEGLDSTELKKVKNYVQTHNESKLRSQPGQCKHYFYIFMLSIFIICLKKSLTLCLLTFSTFHMIFCLFFFSVEKHE